MTADVARGQRETSPDSRLVPPRVRKPGAVSVSCRARYYSPFPKGSARTNASRANSASTVAADPLVAPAPPDVVGELGDSPGSRFARLSIPASEVPADAPPAVPAPDGAGADSRTAAAAFAVGAASGMAR